MTSDGKHFRGMDMTGAVFDDVNLTDATFREVDLTGARVRGALLVNADFDGLIDGMKVNGVEVMPLVEAELDRLHPERVLLRSTTPEGLREAWAFLEAMWAQTMKRAAALPEAALEQRVGGEWSFAETLRHLVFVIDAWFGNALRGDPRPYHPLSLPAAFLGDDGAALGCDPHGSFTYDEVVAVRAERVAAVRSYLETVTREELDRPRETSQQSGFPPAQARTAVRCLHVVLNEEWWHHRFAVRDLEVVEAG